MNKHIIYFVSFLTILIVSCQNETTTIQTPTGQKKISTDELLKIMGESYLYGYPLILMDLTKKVITNIDAPHPTKASAPINQLGHFREFPDHTLTAIVKPNVDTYYSIVWFDLKKEPQVLFMPATDRYYLLPMLDAYTNVFTSPGTRTTGNTAQYFLIAGPDWKGDTPDGMQLIKAPTQMVWMLGRIQVNSPEDGATVVKSIQDSMKVFPLSAYEKNEYIHPKGNLNKEVEGLLPVKAVRDLDVNSFFGRLSELMAENPPPDADSTMLQKMEKIGFIPGQPFNISTDNLILKTKLKRLPDFIHKKMEDRRANPDPGLLTNGWGVIKEDIGTYGTDYIRRAFIAFIGLGACVPEDAIYPNCIYDINGHLLDAKNKYQIHFSPAQIPPVKAFWSLTAYNEDEFLVKNKFNRFALGDRNELNYNKDESLDLFIQSSPPEKEKMNNWLPIPEEGPFYLTLRMYWPKEDVLKGDWEIPPVIPVK